MGLQDKPKTPRFSQHVEHKRVATPLEDPVGTELEEEPVRLIEEGLTPLGDMEGHTPIKESVGLTPTGVTDGLTLKREIVGVTQHKEGAEPTTVTTTKEQGAAVDEDIKVIDLDTPEGVASEDVGEVSAMIITRLCQEFITIAHKPEQEQFWKDMGLHDFVQLNWGTSIGSDRECREFILNSTPVAMLVDGKVINITKEALAKIFQFGKGKERDMASRARAWQSQKFSTLKEKNGYKLTNCTNSNLVERLEFIQFIRASLYLQDRKNLITGV
ncbi:unnamed protein product [Calypogeia fissa]